jgi:hypothetical protein
MGAVSVGVKVGFALTAPIILEEDVVLKILRLRISPLSRVTK